MATVGENIRALRKSMGFSQERFAREIGSNQITLSSWEIGSRMPAISSVRHIAETFKVPLSSLIPLGETGMDDDVVREIADMLQRDPKLRLLFDRAKHMSPSDIDAVLGVVNAITKERGSND